MTFKELPWVPQTAEFHLLGLYSPIYLDNGPLEPGYQGAFKHLTGSFVSLTEGCFSEHQNSVVQNILLP